MQQMETLPSGTILHGRYRVERALGSGGFGHVYLSVDLQTNTQYAIKEYLVTGASGKIQLEHEAQVLSQLHHPNLPAFLSAFDEGGHYYVVLGYIEGNDLTDFVRIVRQKNEVIPVARLMEWVLSICDAVSFLHSQHPPIIHRDIKPDNIRITPTGTATLVDLGNAKTALDGARTLFFIRHQGTPGYAPLEQYPGGNGTDERSDVYALGGTLYFALTAHEPPSVSARNQSLQQKQIDLPTLQERLAQNPPDGPQEARQFRLGVSKPAKPVPRHSRHLAQLGQLHPELLRKLDAIIQRAMAMKPKDRYQSVADLSNDLKLVIKALPDSTTPPVVNGRVVDPHSTQPDLALLYEAIQTQTGQNQSTTESVQTMQQPVQTPPVQTPNNISIRCPRCGTELPQSATFCPRCGTSLQQQSQQPRKQMGSSPNYPERSIPQSLQGHDISAEETMLIPPGAVPQDINQTYRQKPSSAQIAPRPATSNAQATAATARQQMLKTPSQPIPAVQPQSLPYNPPPKATRSGTQANVKPFIPAATPATNRQTPPASSPTPIPPAGGTNTRQNTNTGRNILVAVVIILVALLIIMLLLLAFLHNHG
jgi:serine/threonine protein kinase